MFDIQIYYILKKISYYFLNRFKNQLKNTMQPLEIYNF